MNCLDFVINNVKEEDGLLVLTLLESGMKLQKNNVRIGDLIIFAYNFHIGFGYITEFLNVKTIEVSDNLVLNRLLNLHDSNLRIIAINPKLKKGKVKKWQERF